MIPGIGPILGAGPLIAALGGAGIGALAGGMVGALTDAGIPEQDANIYSEGVRRGGTLVLAYVAEDTADRAAEIMNRHHPVDIDKHAPQQGKHGWDDFNTPASALLLIANRNIRSNASRPAHWIMARERGPIWPGSLWPIMTAVKLT